MANVQEPLGGSQDMQDTDHGNGQSGRFSQDESISSNTDAGHSLPAGTQHASQDGRSSSMDRFDLESLNTALDEATQAIGSHHTGQQHLQDGDFTGRLMLEMTDLAELYHGLRETSKAIAQNASDLAKRWDWKNSRLNAQEEHAHRMVNDVWFVSHQTFILTHYLQTTPESRRDMVYVKDLAQQISALAERFQMSLMAFTEDSKAMALDMIASAGRDESQQHGLYTATTLAPAPFALIARERAVSAALVQQLAQPYFNTTQGTGNLDLVTPSSIKAIRAELKKAKKAKRLQHRADCTKAKKAKEQKHQASHKKAKKATDSKLLDIHL
ncbi:hypothetical protein PG999_005369 [Apiospora kogelbergensis]|uniref:Uncharacterized protein n=1 Tax=Apiospora kogelbergensis TaxID=1337665 RepID=A0AAW0R1Z8_9PEZI